MIDFKISNSSEALDIMSLIDSFLNLQENHELINEKGESIDKKENQ
jgi:hypothetical protein